jgi:hypothetical protein
MQELLKHLIEQNEEEFDDLFKPASDEEAEERLDALLASGRLPEELDTEIFDTIRNELYHVIEKEAKRIKHRYPKHWQQIVSGKEFYYAVERGANYVIEIGDFQPLIIDDLENE